MGYSKIGVATGADASEDDRTIFFESRIHRRCFYLEVIKERIFIVTLSLKMMIKTVFFCLKESDIHGNKHFLFFLKLD